jgi:hypothetical protein
MAGRDPDPVPEPSLWLAPARWSLSSSPGQRAPAVPPPATQAHRAVDCIGSMATSAQLRALVNDFADPLGWRVVLVPTLGDQLLAPLVVLEELLTDLAA